MALSDGFAFARDHRGPAVLTYRSTRAARSDGDTAAVTHTDDASQL
jgi:hypothetical protein